MNRLSIIIFLLLFRPGIVSAGYIHPPENISSSLYKEYNLRISPGGRYIAFCMESGGDENIYIMELQSRVKRQITFHSASDYSPCFMGDGRILFVSRRGNSLGDIYITDLQGKKKELLIGGRGYFDTPATSRNEKRIAYVHSPENDSVFIYISDRKGEKSARGPQGINPAFFPSGDSLVFVTPAGEDNNNELAVYSLLDSSTVYLGAGEGLKLNPVVLDNGRTIIFERKSRDSDGDGIISIKDESDLVIFDLYENRARRFLPGFNYTEPAVSHNNILCARGTDGDFYRIPVDGLSDKEAEFERQNSLCDSLARYALNYNDSLLAAEVCYEGYNYYPELCGNLIIRSALIFSMLDRYDLALDILSEMKTSADSVLVSAGRLAEADIRYRLGRKSNNIKDKLKAVSLCEDLIDRGGIPDSISRKAYQFCFELYFNEGMYDQGKTLIEKARDSLQSDRIFQAMVDRWDLKFRTKTYAGDINDLIPLYLDLLDRYKLLADMDKLLVGDLIELVSSGNPDNALDALEGLKKNYDDYPLIAGSASLEQANLLMRRGLKSLAEWRLTEIIDNFPDDPELRFTAFVNLFDIYLEKAEFDHVDAMIDSISAYMDYTNNFALAESYKIKASEYYTFRGNDILKSNPEEAAANYRKALLNDARNKNALWGLARAGYKPEKGKDDFPNMPREGEFPYLVSLVNLVEYIDDEDVSSLEKARKGFLRVIDNYPTYAPPYLSVGYADCLLEEYYAAPRGFYEEAVEYSLKGISHAAGDDNLRYAFYINLAEAYYGLKQFEEAFKYYSLVKEGIPSYEDSSGFIIKYGECAFNIDSLDIADRYFKRLYEISSNSGDEKTKSLSAIKLGLINQSQGKYVEAAEYYEIAKRYYAAEKKQRTMGDLLKAQAFCLKMAGDDRAAVSYADRARDLFDKSGYHGAKYDYRVKFVWWPFGISIPLIELLPMRYGGSLYPEGFTAAANKAFLRELSNQSKDVTSGLNLKRDQIKILDDAGEDENSVDLWDEVGAGYFTSGHGDSAAAAFNKAYRLCMKLEDYHGAYIELLNWAEVVLNRPIDLPGNADAVEEVQNKALDLYDYILPSYPNARANLKNIAGLAEYNKGLKSLAKFPVENSPDLESYLSALGKSSDESYNYFQKAKYYFQEGLTGLIPGEYPGLETGLLLNDAVVSYSMGDYDNADISIRNAEKSAVLSESARLYATVLGFKTLAGVYNTNDNIEKLLDAVRIFDNMPIEAGYAVDLPYIMILHRKIIEYYIDKGDFQSGLYYLEVMKKLPLVSRLTRVNTALYKSDYFRANLSLLNQYQRDLVGLESEKRKLESYRSVAQISLKNLTDTILRKRGRLLELQQETREIDPVAYSSLVIDVPPVKLIMERIPQDEICLIPYDSRRGSVFWVCSHDSIQFVSQGDLNNPENAELLKELSGSKIITIVSPDETYEPFREYVQNRIGDVTIKRALSLDAAYPGDIGEMKRVDGILLVRFQGYILSDAFAGEIGARVLDYDSGFSDIDLSNYGWIIFDGELTGDSNNFLFSYWKSVGGPANGSAGNKFAVYDLPKLNNRAFGVLLIDGAGASAGADEGVLVKLVENMGIGATVTVSEIRNPSRVAEKLKIFFSRLDVDSPLMSYHNSLGGGMSNRDFAVSYYGEDGWSGSEAGKRVEDLYDQYLVIGNQYYVQNNWRMAQKYYELALKIAGEKKFRHSSGAVVVRKLMQTYEKMGEYQSLIQKDISNFIDILRAAADTVYLIKIYRDMAGIKYSEYRLEESIDYSTSLIKIAAPNDISSLAEGYSVRGKAYLELGELDKAAADLQESARLFSSIVNFDEAHFSMLYIARILNMKEKYGPLKAILDSLQIQIDQDSESEIYNRYMVQLAKYQMVTLKSESAKRNLESIAKNDNPGAEAFLLLGKIFLMRRDPDSALTLAREGLSSIRAKNEYLLLEDAHELLGDIYRLSGNNEDAATQYNLAYDIIKDFRYGDIIDLLRYKIVLVSEGDAAIKDSLFSEILSATGSEFVKGLCLYQIGYDALEGNDGLKAQTIFDQITELDDFKTARYLKWRSYYNLALSAKKDRKMQLFKRAEEICGNHPGEPDYIKSYYGLNEERQDLYFSMADDRLSAGDKAAAVDYMETGFAAKISGRHFAVGCYDKSEFDLLDRVFIDSGDTASDGTGKSGADSLKADRSHRVLWGESSGTVENLQAVLKSDEAIVRFYQIDSGFTAVYLDSDSMKVVKCGFSEGDLLQTFRMIGDLMANQSKSDSVLEKWYGELIGPFENLLLEKEKVILVPDGALQLLPLEALKMPDADYISEMFEVKRNISLPQEFPADVGRNKAAFPAFEPSYNSDVGLIRYIAEPFSSPSHIPGSGVSFYAGDFSFFENASDDVEGMVCMVEPANEKNLSNLVLQAFLSLRNGNYGFVFPLWGVSNEIKSTYYWKLLKNLAEGDGFWKSWYNSRSYLFGHFEGLPYFWGGSAYLDLN